MELLTRGDWQHVVEIVRGDNILFLGDELAPQENVLPLVQFISVLTFKYIVFL